MTNTRILLTGLWIALMFTYLLGDVLRIFAGDVVLGEIEGTVPGQAVWFGIALYMLIPIVMIVLTLIVGYPAIRWTNIIVPIFLIIFNIFGLPYKGAYDNFLIGVGFVLNSLTIWYAWKWII